MFKAVLTILRQLFLVSWLALQAWNKLQIKKLMIKLYFQWTNDHTSSMLLKNKGLQRSGISKNVENKPKL